MFPSRIPLIHIVPNPDGVQPVSGCFAQLSMERMFITELSFTLWKISIQSVIGGQQFPPVFYETNLRINGVIEHLSKWEHEVHHIYLTEEAALELLPEMCAPRVPFALAVPNPDLKKLCLATLHKCLRFD